MENKNNFLAGIMVVILIVYLLMGFRYFGTTSFPQSDAEMLYAGIVFLLLAMALNKMNLSK